MPLDNAWNAYIFRDGKTRVCGRTLQSNLADGLLAFHSVAEYSRSTVLIDLLLRAGELECALYDSASPRANTAADITDAIATALVTKEPLPAEDLSRQVTRLEVIGDVQVAV